jgi:hypothetical protein
LSQNNSGIFLKKIDEKKLNEKKKFRQTAPVRVFQALNRFAFFPRLGISLIRFDSI